MIQDEIDALRAKILARKRAILEEFRMMHANDPPQGSPGWFAARSEGIGASEIADLVGKGRGSKIDIIKKKVGLKKFVGNPACSWGHLFEEINRQACALRFNCTIEEFSSLTDEKCPAIRGSPDGIGVTNIKYSVKTNKAGIISYVLPTIVLFEFKCPAIAIPNYISVPPDYNCQVLSGMCSASIAEHGIYSACMFRKCSIDAYLRDDDSFDTTYHFKKHNIIPTRIRIGLIGLAVPNTPEGRQYMERKYMIISLMEKSKQNRIFEDDFTETELNAIAANRPLINSYRQPDPDNVVRIFPDNEPLIDYGDMSARDFNEMMTDIKDENIPPIAFYPDLGPTIASAKSFGIVKYPKVYLNKFKADFAEFCKKYDKIPYGFIPWKMFIHNVICVNKDPEFNSRIYDDAVELMNIVKMIKEHPDGVMQGFMKYCGLPPDKQTCLELMGEINTEQAELEELLAADLKINGSPDL